MKILRSKQVSKATLNISYAEFIWPDRLAKWEASSPIKNHTKIGNTNEPEYWFYVPEFNKQRGQLEVKCIDSSHLLTRTRRKICKNGVDGISNGAWLKVARQRNTFLSLVMIEDLVDPMSVGMALTHLSRMVEDEMRANGDVNSADLCSDIRQWWLAEDEPGISASKRISMRTNLRARLLRDINFGRFPPQSMYIRGWPMQLWEALISSIDAKAMLYALCKSGTYNVRAFSSMMGETFFAELTNTDKSGHGTVSAADFGSYLGNTVEQLHTRLDPDRCFAYRTSKSTVYNTEGKKEHSGYSPTCDTESLVFSSTTIHSITPRNHFFDSEERRRLKGRPKETKVSMDRNALQKGSLGVRWEKARINESKILPTRKMGLE